MCRGQLRAPAGAEQGGRQAGGGGGRARGRGVRRREAGLGAARVHLHADAAARQPAHLLRGQDSRVSAAIDSNLYFSYRPK